MRYTTIIDLREWPQLYKNDNAKLLYLHLALISGYHDDDRDQTKISFRGMAEETGLTLSAVRHAVATLTKAGLLTRKENVWTVKKFVIEKPVTPRIKSEKKRIEAENRARERQIEEERKKREREEREKFKKAHEAGRPPIYEHVKKLMAAAAAGDAAAASSLGRYKKIVEEIQKTDGK